MRFGLVLRYYWPFIKKHPIRFWGGFVVTALALAAADIFAPFYIREIIDTISVAERTPEAKEALMHLIFAFSMLLVAQFVLFRAADLMAMTFRNTVIKNLTDFTFEKLLNQSYAFFTNNFSGSLVAKTARFRRSFHVLYDNLLYTLWWPITPLIGMFIILFGTDKRLGIFFLSWSAVYIIVTMFVTWKKIPYDVLKAQKDSLVTARLADSVTNILNIKMFASRRQEEARFKDETTQEARARGNAWMFQTFIFTLQAFFMIVLEIGGLYLSIHLWLIGEITVGTIVLAQLYYTMVFGYLWNLGRGLVMMSEAMSDAQEMIEILETKPDIEDSKYAEPPRIKKGAIHFDNVTFSHTGEDLFKDFSLKIPAGQKVGLVGHSGSGKTTITKLLLRFSDVDDGSITIDGQDVRRPKQDTLRRSIAYVPQDPILFHRTLKENISYAYPRVKNADMIRAAKKAHAHEFISNLDDGYNTLVGERGIKLSGGERQRVAIARAMLKKAPILVLDEATSALDSVSERLIQDAFKSLMRGKTSIVIAHRLSTIQNMDRIIVLEKGKIVEDGTHKELLKKKGAYYTFWEEQTNGFIE